MRQRTVLSHGWQTFDDTHVGALVVGYRLVRVGRASESIWKFSLRVLGSISGSVWPVLLSSKGSQLMFYMSLSRLGTE